MRTHAPVVVTQFYAPETMGTAFYTEDLARGLAPDGASTVVVTGEPYYPEFARYAGYENRVRFERLNGVDVLRVPTLIPTGGRNLLRILSDANFLLQGLARFGTRRARSVVSFAPGTTPVILGAVLARNGRHVVIVHDIQSGLASGTGRVVNGLATRILQALEAWALNRADHIAVLSTQMGQELVNIGVDAAKVVVVPIWLRDDLWRDAIFSEDLPSLPTATYSGSVGSKQGLERLVDVGRRMSTAGLEHRIVIRGEGPAAATLRDRAKHDGVKLDFEDLVPQAELPIALTRTWVHVLPQRPGTSNFSVPSKVLNILASGRPLVVETDKNSPLDDLAKDCPAVIATRAGDASDFEDAVSALLADKEECLRLGRIGRQYVLANFSRESVLSRLGTLLDG